MDILTCQKADNLTKKGPVNLFPLPELFVRMRRRCMLIFFPLPGVATDPPDLEGVGSVTDLSRNSSSSKSGQVEYGVIRRLFIPIT